MGLSASREATPTVPSHPSGEDIVVRRKRLKFRSWHRGTKEMDLLLGPFADAQLDGYDLPLLAEYEAILHLPEPDLYEWIVGRSTPPEAHRSTVLDRLIAFYAAPHAR
ncbi:MAG: succinate dehydrogenase assembly factor 2 [Rhodospirillaceae bacterium]|nr:succinate dehydrogenase assembly factor 2 [Rhodospirillaceae bacterium]